MANSPSKRNHRHKPLEGLNLTPFIDMITCLMFFLMMFAGIIPVVIIDAPLPKIASTADDLGAPGYDGIYGHGLVNAAAATTP